MLITWFRTHLNRLLLRLVLAETLGLDTSGLGSGAATTHPGSGPRDWPQGVARMLGMQDAQPMQQSGDDAGSACWAGASVPGGNASSPDAARGQQPSPGQCAVQGRLGVRYPVASSRCAA